ncbi:MAG TPA: glycosyl hydrolase family 18 protein [Bacillota bacterium]|nr:glycosyl hydrolase family 18 protein [Bacillota bacterium]
MQPNTTVTALVVLLYIASSITGMRASKPGSQVLEPPGVHETVPTPQTQNNALKDLAGRSAAVSDDANVRSGPGTRYSRVCTLAKNTHVRLVGEVNGWYQVVLPKGGYGWIAGALLQIAPPAGSLTQPRHDVVGYYTVNYPGDRSSYDVVHAYSDSLTAIAPFSFAVDGSGNVQGDHSTDAMKLAASKGLANLALIHNLTGQSFNKGQISAMLNSRPARQRAVSDILEIVKTHGYSGVNIDFENVPPADRAQLTQFMKELRAALAPSGYRVTMSVPAKHKDAPTSAWVGAFDYYELGRVCDQVMIMTYDEHTSGTRPGPIASLPWVEKVVKYASTQMPKRKVLLGVAAYGYDWNTSTNRARAVTYQQAVANAAKHGKKIQWDAEAATPHYRYKSGNVTREVWFESADSLKAKLKLVEKYGLGGIAIWRLGQEDAGYWELIQKELLK